MNNDYLSQLKSWQDQMEEDIRAENSWLALAGLFWLKEGRNSFGSDPSNAVVLPERVPAHMGAFVFDGESVLLEMDEGQQITLNGEQTSRSVLDAESVLTFDGIRMIVIQRPSGTAIRLWDNQREERRIFPALTWYEPNERFRIPATYMPYPQPKPVTHPDTFGNMVEGEAHGQVSFEFEGQTYSLEATMDEEDRLFMQFRDTTSGQGTYPSGRYYFTMDPVVDGRIMLDFNYAYNPPCAVTPYATCVFAPEQNTLPFRVVAGEKFTDHH